MLTKISEILSEKGGVVQSVAPETLVSAAVNKMHDLNIGALIVMHDTQVTGIFTERDVLFRVVNEQLDPTTTRVDQVMTRDPFAVSPTITVRDAMSLITEKRFRHLPVVENGQLCGLISSGDLTRSLVKDQENQIDALIRSVKSMAHRV